MRRRYLLAAVAGLSVCAACQKDAPPAPVSPPPVAPSSQPLAAASNVTPAPRLAPEPTAEARPVDPSRLPGSHTHRHAPLDVCRSPGDPLDAARRLYDEHRFGEALSCAAQATAFFPDLPQAHSEKAAALSALGRFAEAELAYARALALSPDHPDALLGASHLYAVSLPSSREHDELAAVYADRGFLGARASGDRPLVAQFALISAMALNDLGRAAEALGRADEVLGIENQNHEAAYERAVALFELCRFDEARTAFRELLEDPQRGAHAHHHLALILERDGKLDEAESHFAIARKLAPEDFPPPQLLSKKEFQAELQRAIAALPEDMKRDLASVPVTAEELPKTEDLVGGEPPLSPTILGLFRGPPLGERCEGDQGQACRSVALYRRNLARAVQSRAELTEQIRVTLLHEVGHLRGEDDLELAARGLE